MKSILVILLFLVAIKAKAQTHKFGDVPKEQLEMEVYEGDSTANAVVLFSKGEAELEYLGNEFYLTVKRHVRIKILSDEGLDEGDIEISYRNKKASYPQKINDIKAESYTLSESGEVIKESVGRRDRFEEELSEYFNAIKFTIPGLKTGSVFEYSYELVSNDPVDFPSWFFQSDMPVVWSEYTARIPEWFRFLTYKRGFNSFFIEEQTPYSDRFNYSDGYGNSQRVEFNGMEYHYVMKDLPALRQEPYMKATMDYLSHIRFQLSAFQPPLGSPTYYLDTWPGLASQLLEDEDFGDRLSYSPMFIREVSEIVDGIETDFEKMVAIYNHVSEHMEWNEKHGLYAFDDLRKIYEEGTGNGTSINLILIQMLKDAGLEVYPVALSTRTNGEIVSLFPLLGQLNHTIAYVQLDEYYHLLDAKNEIRPYNLLPSEVLNGEGLVIIEDQAIWIPLENQIPNRQIDMLRFQIMEDGYTGTLESKNQGFYAVDKRVAFDFDDLPESVDDAVFTPEGGFEVDSVAITKDELNESFEYSAHFSFKDENVGDVMYFNPFITGIIDENPFKLEERTFPVDFNFTFSDNKIIYITVPEGWEVDEAPETVLLGLPEQAGEFRRVVQVHGNIISINYRFNINKIRFMPGEYGAIKQFYDQMVSSMSENIVLKKSS